MVSSMQTAHFYRQRLDAGELYFLALDPLKNGGWRGLLVRHYARPEKAVKTTVPKMSFRLWEHVASVPKEVEKRFNDAGNLGTMRNRKRNGLREIGRKIAKGAKGIVERTKKAMQDERDDEHVAKVREYALGAGAQWGANNVGEARHQLRKAHDELDVIRDPGKRERAAKTLHRLEGLLGVYRNRGTSKRRGIRRNNGDQDRLRAKEALQYLHAATQQISLMRKRDARHNQAARDAHYFIKQAKVFMRKIETGSVSRPISDRIEQIETSYAQALTGAAQRNRGRGSGQVGPSRASSAKRSSGIHSTRFWGN